MNLFGTLFCVFLLGASEAPKKGTYTYSLNSFQGKKNVLLIFAPSKKDPRFSKQLESVSSRYADFKKVQTVLFYVFESEKGRADSAFLREVDAADLRKSFKVSEGSFRIILVDKQGQAKKDSKEPLEREALNKFLGLKSPTP